MYFWKIKKLEKELVEGIAERETFKYFLAFSLLSISAYYLGEWSGLGFLWLNFTLFLLELGLTIAGISYCFFINEKGDNKDFIKRYVCLSFPVGVRLISLFIGVIFLMSLLDIVLNATIDVSVATMMGSTHWLDIVMVSGVHIMFYYWMGKSLKRLKSLGK